MVDTCQNNISLSVGKKPASFPFPPHMRDLIPYKWASDGAALRISQDSAQILALLLSWPCGRMEPEVSSAFQVVYLA